MVTCGCVATDDEGCGVNENGAAVVWAPCNAAPDWLAEVKEKLAADWPTALTPEVEDCGCAVKVNAVPAAAPLVTVVCCGLKLNAAAPKME